MTHAGLIYAYMESYIANHANAEQIKKVYNEQRLIGACHKVSYPTIKKWFLETYPEIAEFRIKEDDSNQENKPDADENVTAESVEAA